MGGTQGIVKASGSDSMRIGIYSDTAGLTTGYGQQSMLFLMELKKRGHEVFSYGIQYVGFPITVNGITIYPASTDEEFRRSINMSKPDVVISSRDLWQYSSFNAYGEHHLIGIVHDAGAKLVNFSPIQVVPMPKAIDEVIEKDGDFTLFSSRYALKHFQGKGHDRIGYLPYCIDPRYQKVDISRYDRPYGLPKGSTMLMNVGYALDPRKQTPLVLKLLSDYRQYDPTAFAYMHTLPRSYYANDVFQENLGLPKGSVIFKHYTDAGNNVHDAEVTMMNQLYNSADVFINLASSEGFGLPAVEAASLGIPVMVTDTPVHREVLGMYKSVRFIKSYQWIPSVWWFEYMPDMDVAFETLMKIKDTEFRKEKPYVFHEHTPSAVIDMLEKVLESLEIKK